MFGEEGIVVGNHTIPWVACIRSSGYRRPGRVHRKVAGMIFKTIAIQSQEEGSIDFEVDVLQCTALELQKRNRSKCGRCCQ